MAGAQALGRQSTNPTRRWVVRSIRPGGGEARSSCWFGAVPPTAGARAPGRQSNNLHPSMGRAIDSARRWGGQIWLLVCGGWRRRRGCGQRRGRGRPPRPRSGPCSTRSGASSRSSLASASPGNSSSYSSPPPRSTIPPPPPPPPREAAAAYKAGTSGNPVGCHGIWIRPWPHPDHVDVMRAHRIMERVLEEKRHWYGIKETRQVLVVTLTYSRAFQALHLTGLLHSLYNVRYPLTWILVEAGGTTNATASLLARSGLTFVHIPVPDRIPHDWADLHATKNRIRLHAYG